MDKTSFKVKVSIGQERYGNLDSKGLFWPDQLSSNQVRGNAMENDFEIVSGKVFVSDPCYDLDTHCTKTLDGVKKGTWSASVEKNGNRVAALTACHKSFQFGVPSGIYLHVRNADIGVDSGQAGIFDFKHFKDDTIVPKDVELESYGNDGEVGDLWYDLCCNVTLDRSEPFGAIPFGCVSQSGYGDGSYDLYVAKNTEGEIVGIKIVFI